MADQQVPVKLYRSARRVTVAAAMPGVEPEDIHISLSGQGELTLRAEERATFKGENDVVMDEWNPGAYSRTLKLNEGVDAKSADASYQNGVLVVSLPMSDSISSGDIRLKRVGQAEGRKNG